MNTPAIKDYTPNNVGEPAPRKPENFVPAGEKREERKRLYIWIPKKLYADLQYRANMADRTLVDYVTDVLTEHIRRDVDEI